MISARARSNALNQSGFTLVEIMVALMIAAVAVVAIVDAIGKTSFVASELEQRVLAGWIASNEIAEIRYDAKVNKIKQGSSSNSVEMGGLEWRVKSRISKTDVENVFLITVEVQDRARSKDAPFASMTSAITDRL